MKIIAIISNTRKHEIMNDIHEWLDSNNIAHNLSINRKKIFMKDLTLIFESELNYKGLRADGYYCWDDYIVNYILSLYSDKVIKKREGWLW